MSINQARSLRRDMTVAERKLWRLLRYKAFENWKFPRQHVIGRFVADFACPQAMMVVEVDGSQHAGNAYDAERTAWLEGCGWRVLRFWNNEVLENPEGVAQVLSRHLNPHPPIASQWAPPSPIGGRA